MKITYKIQIPLMLFHERLKSFASNAKKYFSFDSYTGVYKNQEELVKTVWYSLAKVSYSSKLVIKDPENFDNYNQMLDCAKKLSNVIKNVAENGGVFGKVISTGYIMNIVNNFQVKEKTIKNKTELATSFTEDVKNLQFFIRNNKKAANIEVTNKFKSYIIGEALSNQY